MRRVFLYVFFSMSVSAACAQGNNLGDACSAAQSEKDAVSTTFGMRTSAENAISRLKKSNDPNNIASALGYVKWMESADRQLENLLKQREVGVKFKPSVYEASCSIYARLVSEVDLRLGQGNLPMRNTSSSGKDVFMVCSVHGSTSAQQIIAFFDDKHYLSRVINPDDKFDLLLSGSYESRPPHVVITEKMGKFLSHPNPAIPKGWLNNTKSNSIATSNYLIKTFKMKKIGPDDWELGYVRFENWDGSDVADRSDRPPLRCKNAPANIKQMMIDQRDKAPSR